MRVKKWQNQPKETHESKRKQKNNAYERKQKRLRADVETELQRKTEIWKKCKNETLLFICPFSFFRLIRFRVMCAPFGFLCFAFSFELAFVSSEVSNEKIFSRELSASTSKAHKSTFPISCCCGILLVLVSAHARSLHMPMGIHIYIYFLYIYIY